MSEHRAKITWQLQGAFDYKTYSRSHAIEFEGGIRVPGNAAAGNVPATVTPAVGIDPEQAFVASLSACHMLWFLHLACQEKLTVTRYVDDASGVLEKNPAGVLAMTRVTLRPVVSFAGVAPDPAGHERLHHRAHEKCFIANSVSSEVIVEPRIA